MIKPRIVERKVKPMSVQASPVVKKIIRVLKIALGCDQKNGSIQVTVAANSQNAMAPTRMPICVARMAAVGQSFCTGSRRTGRAEFSAEEAIGVAVTMEPVSPVRFGAFCVVIEGLASHAASMRDALVAPFNLRSSRQRSLMAMKFAVSVP